MDPSSAGLPSRTAGAAPVPLAEREQIVLPAPPYGAQPLETGVALLERKVDPPPPLVPCGLVALVDERLIGAVGMFLRLDEQVEARRVSAEGDVFVSFAVPLPSEPGMPLRSGLEVAMDPGDTPDVVEDDVVVRAFGDHSARLEHAVGGRRADELGELAFGDEDHDRVRAARHGPDSI